MENTCKISVKKLVRKNSFIDTLVEDRKILSGTLKKLDECVWIGLKWLSIAYGVGSCEHDNGPLGSMKGRISSE
jgi:hypothetical protein